MLQNTRTRDARAGERGATLITIAIALTFILGITGLAIDLAALYVGRSEAQRSADAAALAGATTFVTSGFTSGGVTQAVAQTLATSDAIAVGNQNLVGGQNPNIASGDVTFDFSLPGDPRVTVVVQRTLARGNAMPTFFVKIFGITTADVSATATAEAYNPSGQTGGPPFCASCLKPFLLPNCDPARTTPASTICPGMALFINPDGTIANPSRSPTGVVGETWVLHSLAGPSQWYSIAVGSDQSKATWKAAIAGCNAVLLGCGDLVWPLDGLAVGPANQAIDDLINASRNGPGNGQDTITVNTDLSMPPFTITGGANNPNPAAVGQTIVQSSSIMTVAIFDGSVLIPGGGIQAKVVGFMQVFVQYVSPPPAADITVTIMNVTGCGTGTGGGSGSCGSSGGGGGSGTGGTISGGGASTIPVRLIRPGS
jgi:hypothetical protein